MENSKVYQAYYTKSEPIINYMVRNLQLSATDKIFEPCGGDGVFVENILLSNPQAQIDIFELNPNSFSILNNKFGNNPLISIKNCNTLFDNELLFKSSFGGIYDKIIANPPYGAWIEYEKRKDLKKLYPNLYVKETYALFLFRCIELLKENGKLVFIIPNTYLNLHLHKEIRKHILTKTKIIEILLFPSSFFPNVNFGYADLSIITLQKCSNLKECQNNKFKIISKFNSVADLQQTNLANFKTHNFSQLDILNNSDYAFYISDDNCISKLISNTEFTIGDVANCVTGFYSGDDKEFLKVINSEHKNGKNYETIKPEQINNNYKNIENILDGLETENNYIPIVKGGNTKYLKQDCWFMNWSKEAVNHYKTDKKTRFQNRQFYFRYGIGVPMISSSSITASLIENKIFDQSIVGVFPKNIELTYYLLAFLNSPTCNKLIRTINPSANNPANYIKKIPFISPTQNDLDYINPRMEQILSDIKKLNKYCDKIENEINNYIQAIYELKLEKKCVEHAI